MAGRQALDGCRAPRPADVLRLVDLGPKNVERSDFSVIRENEVTVSPVEEGAERSGAGLSESDDSDDVHDGRCER
jgi:hypothetical protein